jgi:hypothetical protein
MATLTPEQLTEETELRPRAAYFAFAAAALSLLGGIGALLFSQGLPAVTADSAVDILEAMQARLVDGAEPARSLRAVQFEYLGDHLLGWITPAAFTAFGTLVLLIPIGFIFQATRARKDDLRPLGGTMLQLGGVLSAAGGLGSAIIIGIEASSFTGTSAAEARDALTTQPAIALQVLGFVGSFMFAIGVIIVSLNAMRAGLLTRFVGVLGIVVGASVIVPIQLDQINLLRSSWLLFVGLILLGKMPGASSDPPAWRRGEMIPWPSQQEIRERREAERAAAEGGTLPDTGDAPSRRSRKRRA